MEQPEFWFKQIEETETYCAIRYTGHAAHVVIPPVHWGHPVSALFDDLFKGHTELETVSIPDTVTQIGGFVFDGCTSLRAVTLPAALEDLWQYAFVRSSIEEIVIPDRGGSIIPFTFKDCRNLRRVVCGRNVTKIYDNAFAGCDALQEFRHSPQTEISPNAFTTLPRFVTY